MSTAIKVENLGKKYIIQHQQQSRYQYNSLSESLSRGIKKLGKTLLHPLQNNGGVEITEEFWALKDINFEIKQGDRVGIIGRNGAGKSTLLKILSRITHPSTGKITINGRVSSLLEVGTGFHPELTGRENIFLNGAILGMRKQEIQKKFDEIVDFAEVEKFLDTPVKHYSSGMYVRLAFAVAAHLEPEILIVDEVLAVGDAQFQKKCLGRMEEVGQEGRAILFVSHQMAAIQRLCDKALVLDNGQIKCIDKTETAINLYLGNLKEEASCDYINNLKRSGSGDVIITWFSIENGNGEVIGAASSGETLVLVFRYKCKNPYIKQDISLGFSIHNNVGDTLVVFYSDYMGVTFEIVNSEGLIKCRIERWPFSVGNYYIGVRLLANGAEIDWPRGFIGSFYVESGDFYTTGNFFDSGLGPFLLTGEWTIE
ncbi:ABC transporter ATP-binding protein [Methylomonas sp. CM2]|uniref:ABC transporter ATP-binding protein n=1 Tax=Methylomonas sp. CM2 TaxID=3417647 RepID=UPI003CF71C23